jgi:hypothetical protein
MFLTFSGFSQPAGGKVAAPASEWVRHAEAQLLELATRHNACNDWIKALPDRGLGKFFTVDLSRALVRTNGQAVSMIAELEDVLERDGVFTADFFMLPSLQTVRQYFPLRLSLRCTAQQADSLLRVKPSSLPSGLGMQFAVVAKVQSLSRPTFEAVASESGDVYQIDFGSSPVVFFAKGTCVDVLWLEPGAGR